MVHIGAAPIALVQTLNPLLTALLAWPLLGERLQPAAMAGLVLGAAGVVLIVGLAATRSPLELHGLLLTAAGRWACVAARFISDDSVAACRSSRGRRCNCSPPPRHALAATALFETPHAEWTDGAVAAVRGTPGRCRLAEWRSITCMLVRGTAARATANFYLVPGTAALMAWALLDERLSALTVADWSCRHRLLVVAGW